MTTPPLNARAIFDEALEIADADARRAFLDRVCADAPELRHKVEALLHAHDEAGSFLAQPAGSPVLTVDHQRGSEGRGTVIGPYKLVQAIGEGGMGTVWMAQQTEPVKRLVAVKLIKAGMDSKQVLARFEAERQALALMDHPHIAKVHDAGTTPDGRPYFVMELVKGVPITRYCDEQRLTPRQRLELFIPVCQAIQHAHQKGIIHRDVKPSNVLVALYDSKPVPKVIDFGIAKATGQQLTEHTLVTGFGAIVGTLEYMSPEQAELNQLDIDTRSDVYSLGVLLYELLTGSTPLEKKRMKEAAMLEVLRLIREEEPPKPSTRLSGTEELPSIAANRGLEPKKLSGLVRGELDWVVMKALEKDRSRRYETANGFAADVQRYLADEAVLACPPSGWYRFRKLIRRNRGPVLAASLLVLALLGGIVGTTVGMVQARTQKDEAEKSATAERLAWEAEREAQKALDAAREEKNQQRTRINRELTATLVEATSLQEKVRNPGPGIRELVSQLRATLRRAETLAGSELADPGLKEQEHTLQETFKQDETNRQLVTRLEGIRQSQVSTAVNVRLGLRSEYEAPLKQYGLPILDLDVAEAARRIEESPIRDWLVAAIDDWAGNNPLDFGPQRRQLLSVAQRADRNVWRRQYFAARIRMDKPALLGLAKQPDAVEQSPSTITMLGRTLFDHDHRTAVDLLRVAQRRYPADPLINGDLAGFLLAMSQEVREKSREEAIRYATESIGFCRVALAARPENEHLPPLLLRALQESGNHDEVVAILREQLRGAATAPGYLSLGKALAVKGDRPGALDAYHEAGKLAADNLAKRRWDMSTSPAPFFYRELGGALRLEGDWEGAVDAYRKLIELEPKDCFTYTSYGQLGKALLHEKDATESTEWYAWANAAAFRKALELYPNSPGAHFALSLALGREGDRAGAASALQKAVDLDPSFQKEMDRILGKPDIDEIRAEIKRTPNSAAYARLAWVLRSKGDLDGAIDAFRKAIELPYCDPGTYVYLADTLRTRGEMKQAIDAYRKAIEIEPRSSSAYLGLGRATLNEKDDTSQDTVPAYREAVKLYPQMPAAHLGLAQALLWKGDRASAVEACRKAVELDPNFTLSQGFSWGAGQVYLALADSLRTRGDMKEAIEAYKRAIEVRNSSTDLQASAFRGLGKALLNEKDDTPQNDAAAYRKVVELYPRAVTAHVALGKALLEKREWDAAILAFRKVLELAPADYRGETGLGYALYAKGDWKEAIDVYSKIIDRHPGRSPSMDIIEALSWRARANLQLDRFEDAVADYRRLLEVAPLVYPVLNNEIAWLLATCPEAKFRDPKRAVELARKAIERAPEAGDYYNTLGVAYYRLGDEKAALAALNKSVELRKGGDAFDFLFLALVHSRLGNRDEARKWYDRAVQWQEKNKEELEKDRVHMAELRRFRSEAEEVLQEKKK
jgi:serine/threonine protein kinase/tetratricopeptide (TPR) repeat protein